MFYFILFGLFLIQEPVSSNVALLEAYQLHYNLWLVHGLFVLATIIDIVLGYLLGIWLVRKLSDNKHVRWFMQKIQTLSSFTGTYGEYLFLFFGGPLLFPYTAVLSPWLHISFKKALTCLLIGDIIFWYGGEWIVVLGVKTFIPDPLLALYAVILVSVFIVFLIKWLRARKNRSNEYPIAPL